jgi:hypothetical protein
MSIDPFAPGSVSARNNGNYFVSLRATLTDLQRQLATGKKADSYGGLGFDRRTSLDFRARMANIDGYLKNIDNATLRLSVMNQTTSSLSKLALDGVASTLPGGYNPGTNGLTNAQVIADGALKQTIDALNADVNGRYLFSGRSTDTQPVVPYDVILNGDTSHAGLKQLISERQQADLGATGLGRTTLSNVGTNVTLAEEAAGLPFGIKISGASSTGGNIASTYNAVSPASASFDVNTQPVDGDTVSIGLSYPDGTTKTLTLTARTALNSGSTEFEFQIGATPAGTAANLNALLQTQIQKEAATTLSAASAEVAANDFFAGSPSNPPVRVAGPPFNTATATTPGTAANTVIWYRGDDTSTSARGTATAQVDATQTVATGAQANEQAFRTMMAQFGALAAQSFPSGNQYSQDRYEAMVQRVHDNLTFPPGNQSIDNIGTELALATTAIQSAKERNGALKSLLQDNVDSVENASTEDVAASILALQTRLQASYQVTSILSQLSLTKYL